MATTVKQQLSGITRKINKLFSDVQETGTRPVQILDLAGLAEYRGKHQRATQDEVSCVPTVQDEPLGMYTMRGSSSLSGISAFGQGGRLVRAGIDTLYVNTFGCWRSGDLFNAISEKLDEAQRTTQEGTSVIVRTRGGKKLEISVGGAGKKNQYYRWKLRYNDIDLLVVKREISTSNRHCGIFIEVGSISSMAYGANIEAILRDLVDDLGFCVTKMSPSRVDFRIDVVGLDVEEVLKAWHAKQHITRAKQWQINGEHDRGNSLLIGARSSELCCNIYDKLLELSSKRGSIEAERKLDFMTKHVWGELPDKATRVEFRAKRQWLKERQVDTLRDLWELTPDIVDYMIADRFEVGEEDHTTAWLTFTETAVDRENKNQSRAGVAAFWLEVRDVASEIGETIRCFIPQDRGKASAEQLMLQGLGCMTTSAVALDVDIHDPPTFARYCYQAALALASRALAKLDEKKLKYG